MIKHQISDTQFALAISRGHAQEATELRARSARYHSDRDILEVETTRDGGFLIPRAWISALQSVPADALSKLEVWPDGSVIELGEHDIHISINGLLTDVLPALFPETVLAVLFARRGGRSTSEAKRFSAQTNGRKGGRPRKSALLARTRDPDAYSSATKAAHVKTFRETHRKLTARSRTNTNPRAIPNRRGAQTLAQQQSTKKE